MSLREKGVGRWTDHPEKQSLTGWMEAPQIKVEGVGFGLYLGVEWEQLCLPKGI